MVTPKGIRRYSAEEKARATSRAIEVSSRARVAKVYTPSQIAQALERVAAIGIRPAAKELEISRNALRDWERKVVRAAKGEGPSPTSGPDPKTVEERRDAAILVEWRKQQGLGPSQIRNQLRRAGTKVSMQTVRRVMEEAGYRPPKVERRDHTGSYEALRPNQLWHMDFLHRYIEEYGVDQLIATTPELNGKSKVFNANLQKECFDRVIFTDAGDLRRRIGPHLSWYNQQPTHHALGGLLVPADRYFGRVEEVLARIETGGGVTDPLDLATRTLELFRVVSHRGKPEIWLMGRRILDLKE